MNDNPTPAEQRALRLAKVLAELSPEDAHGPALLRISHTVIDDLRDHVAEDLLRILERPAIRERLLRDRLREERFGPNPTTTVEGLTRGEGVRA